jgi:Skp family chaperone for outer membrane proteins
MRKTHAILVFILALLAGFSPAAANGCADAASRLAAQNGGQILSVRAVQQGGATICAIKLRIPGQSGRPPRVEEFRVRG